MKFEGLPHWGVVLSRSAAALAAIAVSGHALAGALGDARAAWEDDTHDTHYQDAIERDKVYSNCAANARGLLQGWMDRRQCSETALFSGGGEWDDRNQGADYYSSLVVMAHYVHPVLSEAGGRLTPSRGAKHI
ncbi:MAG: hypothetical protein ACQESR_00630 [Planctomycetota bacterium]